MVSGIRRGWTTPGNADADEALQKEEIFTGILVRRISTSARSVTGSVQSGARDRR